MVELTPEIVEVLAYRLAKKMLEWDEPIPPFDTRFPGGLESCLATPFSTFAGKDLYPSLTDKCAMLFYLMIKNHPFQNGNKRIAVTTLTTFLFLNGKWLSIQSPALYNVATFVAGSDPKHKDMVITALSATIGPHMIDRPQLRDRCREAGIDFPD